LPRGAELLQDSKLEWLLRKYPDLPGNGSGI